MAKMTRNAASPVSTKSLAVRPMGLWGGRTDSVDSLTHCLALFLRVKS
jgi:hypothetical protein